jgi:hypothetical protein
MSSGPLFFSPSGTNKPVGILVDKGHTNDSAAMQYYSRRFVNKYVGFS